MLLLLPPTPLPLLLLLFESRNDLGSHNGHKLGECESTESNTLPSIESVYSNSSTGVSGVTWDVGGKKK